MQERCGQFGAAALLETDLLEILGQDLIGRRRVTVLPNVIVRARHLVVRLRLQKNLEARQDASVAFVALKPILLRECFDCDSSSITCAQLAMYAVIRGRHACLLWRRLQVRALEV